MHVKALWKPVVLYTVVLGLLTVGVIHYTTQSGILVLFGAGGGIILIILSVGTTGPTDGGAFENAEGLDAQGGWTPTSTAIPVSLPLLFYGVGVVLWSVILLVTFYDILG